MNMIAPFSLDCSWNWVFNDIIGYINTAVKSVEHLCVADLAVVMMGLQSVANCRHKKEMLKEQRGGLLFPISHPVESSLILKLIIVRWRP